MTTTVVHCKEEPFDIYIGRQHNGMHYGNPFSFHKTSVPTVDVNTRESAIESFDKWLDGEDYQDVEPERRQWILDHIVDLKDKVLGCHCKNKKNPKPCHGDSLAKRADE